MGSAWNQLEQMLTCPICLDKFKNPRLLPCQHSFCGDSCMDGLVDYARRQIKCPECRAEHRIPYQGVQNLPLNVTLIRFLELHSRITGEEPEPVPTFIEKCSICGEKNEGVSRCAHCDKKSCPECKEAHVDIIKREIGRIGGQTKRCLSKLKDFDESIDKAKSKLAENHVSVRRELQNSIQGLIDDLQAKQKQLLEQADTYFQEESKTLDKLKVAAKLELNVMDSNSDVAEKLLMPRDYSWSDSELWELKEIYGRSMEFMRLFDVDLGDYSRKLRFSLIPEFEAIRKRVCELGELKLGESTASNVANALQYCNAQGQVAQEMIAIANQQHLANSVYNLNNSSTTANPGSYLLSHSNSNNQMLGLMGNANNTTTSSGLLELPGLQSAALMRSQSDHRLASQFQARLKQQQAAQQQQSENQKFRDSSTGRYGFSSSTRGKNGGDFESEMALRSRYAPPRGSITRTDDLTRDWPRPSDSDQSNQDSHSFGFQFKSAYLRRKGNSTTTGNSGYAGRNIGDPDDIDDELTSEASFGCNSSARNVRFNENLDNQTTSCNKKFFDCPELEYAPLSGIPKLEDSTHLKTRVHAMKAREKVEQREAEAEKTRDRDLIESSRVSMSAAQARQQAPRHQASDDDIERQKRANKENAANSVNEEAIMSEREPEDLDEPAPAPVDQTTNRASSPDSGATTNQLSYSTTITNSTDNQSREPVSDSYNEPTSQQQATNSRRNLYSQAINEKSRRQLASAIQEANNTQTRRRQSIENAASAVNSNSNSTEVDANATNESPVISNSTGTRRRILRSSGRSLSKQSSTEQLSSGETGTIQRRPRRGTLQRADSSQQSISSNGTAMASSSNINNSVDSKNSYLGSAGSSLGGETTLATVSSTPQARPQYNRATNTTDDSDEERHNRKESTSNTNNDTRSRRLAYGKNYESSTSMKQKEANQNVTPSGRLKFRYSTSKSESSDEVDDDDDDLIAETREDKTRLANKSLKSENSEEHNEQDDGTNESNYNRNRYSKYRRSREFLPNAVNELLDRSAQIRRDSQEARSTLNDQASPHTNTYSRSATNYSRPNYTTNTSSSASASAISPKTSRRLSSEDQDQDQDHTGRRRSSINTSDSSKGLSSGRRYGSSGRQESSESVTGNSGHTFQSRFLSRSRTSSALPSADLINSSFDSIESQSSRAKSRTLTATSSTSSSAGPTSRSDRYTSNGQTSNNLTNINTSNSTSSYLRPGVSSSSARSAPYTLGSVVNTPLASTNSTRMGHRSSPFIDFDEDEDDETYSAYLPSDSISEKRISRDYETSLSDGQVAFKFGSRGSKAAQLTWPRGVSAHLGQIVVADSSNHRVQVFDSEGNYIREFGSYGSEPGQFDCLAGVAIFVPNKQESMMSYVVSDRYNHRIQIFDRDGQLKRSFGNMGSDRGQLNLPWGVCCAQKASLIFVCDKENHRVQVFSSDGQVLHEFGNDSSNSGQISKAQQMQFPHYLSLNYDESKLAVTDTNNHRVLLFDIQTGQVIRQFGSEGQEQGQFRFPRGIALDSGDCFLVGDSGNNRIQIFDSRASLVRTFGGWGTAAGQFKGIEGVAVEEETGHILVCDRENHRIQVF